MSKMSSDSHSDRIASKVDNMPTDGSGKVIMPDTGNSMSAIVPSSVENPPAEKSATENLAAEESALVKHITGIATSENFTAEKSAMEKSATEKSTTNSFTQENLTAEKSRIEQCVIEKLSAVGFTPENSVAKQSCAETGSVCFTAGQPSLSSMFSTYNLPI